MYSPAIFSCSDRAVSYDLIESGRMGTLISAEPQMMASHIPFMVDRSHGMNGKLIGHLDRNNPQWQVLEQQNELLITFFGPDAYITPSWYMTSPRVPTWYYVATHVYGQVRLITDKQALLDMVVALCNIMEPQDSGWDITQVDEYANRIVEGIVGFDIEINRLETQLRLSQTNNAADKQAVYERLSVGSDNERTVAALIERYVSQ